MNLSTLREFLKYSPESPSGLIWRKATRKTSAGSAAGSFQKQRGYYYVQIQKKKYLAHRVVWALCHGAPPDGMDIDHIDMDGSNNRIENLRLASRSENHRNRKVRPDNKAGVKGLSLRSDGWEGRIFVDGKVHRKFSLSREVVERWLADTRPRLHGEFSRHL